LFLLNGTIAFFEFSAKRLQRYTLAALYWYDFFINNYQQFSTGSHVSETRLPEITGSQL
jgi:hypothetical protein